MDIIRSSIDLIAEPLSFVINLSLSQGIFPTKLKLAKILPIFKSEDPHLFVNYRPISLLCSFSKLFEKNFYNRFLDFIDRLGILHSLQFGFRKNHSTVLSLIYLTNKLAEAIDRMKCQ